MASIEKRNGHYRIIVSVGRDSSGKYIKETMTYTPAVGLTPKQEAKAVDAAALEFENKVKNGEIYDGDKILLSQFAKKWLSEYAKPNLRQRTYEKYEYTISKKIIPLMGHLKIGKITPLHIEEFKNRLLSDGIREDGKPGGYSAGGATKIFAILSSMLGTAVRWDLIDSNPCVKAGGPKQDRSSCDIKSWTLEQANCFLESIQGEELQYRAIAYLALISGMRSGELSALTWQDIDFKKATIDINKSTSMVKGGQIITPPKNASSIRIISVPDEVLQVLKQLQLEQKEKRLQLGSKWQDTGFVFTQWNGLQINYYTPSHWFRKYLQTYNANLEASDLSQEEKEKRFLPNITFHGLRHTSATLLISQHVDVRTVSNRLGHAQTSTTMNIYAHSLKQSDENAANLLGDILRVQKAK